MAGKCGDVGSMVNDSSRTRRGLRAPFVDDLLRADGRAFLVIPLPDISMM